MDRRSFLKGSLAATSSLAAPGIANAGLLDSLYGSTLGGLTGALAASSFNDIELEYVTGGVDPFTGKVVVNHYLPVAFIEVVNSPTDSIVLGNDVLASVAGAMEYGQQSIGSDGITATGNVRIWNFSELLRQVVLKPLCKYCGDETAYFAPEQDLSMIVSGAAAAACAPTTALQAALQKFQDMLLAQSPFSCVPKVYYDSSLDPNWLTNCHDAAVSASLATSLGIKYELACSESTTEIATKIAAKFGLDFGDSINPCIDSWAPLYPRQFSITEPSPALAAAILAYKALHLSAFFYATFPMKVGLGGKFKVVYPATGAPAFDIGSSTSKAGLAAAPAPESGNFGFLYLTPVTCEKYATTITGLCVELACTGMGAAQ